MCRILVPEAYDLLAFVASYQEYDADGRLVTSGWRRPAELAPSWSARLVSRAISLGLLRWSVRNEVDVVAITDFGRRVLEQEI